MGAWRMPEGSLVPVLRVSGWFIEGIKILLAGSILPGNKNMSGLIRTVLVRTGRDRKGQDK